MENRRFLLITLLGVVLFFMWQAWQKDYGPKPPPPAAAPAEEEAPAPGAAPKPQAAPSSSQATPAQTTGAGTRIIVVTDVLRAEIGTTGGDLRRVELLGYPVSKHEPDKPVALVDDRGDHWFVIQSGLAGSQQALVTQRTEYHAAQVHYELAPGADAIDVPLSYDDGRGVTVVKHFRFRRGAYQIGLTHDVRNGGATELALSPYVQMWRTPFSVGVEPRFMKTFMGLGVYEQKGDSPSYRFRKVRFEDLAKEPVQLQQTGGWIAMMQHYFFAAVLPPPDGINTFVGKPGNARGYLAQYVGPMARIAPGAERAFNERLYVGPELQKHLDDVAPGLDLTVDYGLLTPIARALFWLLDLFYQATGNWGFAIILLTLAVRLGLFKLSEAQYRSMAKMRRFGPRIQDLKERYGDDRERLNKAMMELYKKEGFNPLAGCWPLFIQMPIFLALYWVLQQSVELRQASFILWLDDLSAPDPYFVLPVLFGFSMFIQQKLSGSQMTMDPMQQRIMSAMPIMLTAFFAFFPVGLVLYWFVSNVIGIAQQWYIMRKLEREGLGHR